MTVSCLGVSGYKNVSRTFHYTALQVELATRKMGISLCRRGQSVVCYFTDCTAGPRMDLRAAVTDASAARQRTDRLSAALERLAARCAAQVTKQLLYTGWVLSRQEVSGLYTPHMLPQVELAAEASAEYEAETQHLKTEVTVLSSRLSATEAACVLANLQANPCLAFAQNTLASVPSDQH